MSNGVRLSTRCRGHYSTWDNTLVDLCASRRSPLGSLRVRKCGTDQASPEYDLTVSADNVPLASLMRAAANQKAPADLIANGRMNAEFHAMRTQSASQVTGEGTATGCACRPMPGEMRSRSALFRWRCRNGQAKLAKRGSAAHDRLSEPAESYLQIGPHPAGDGRFHSSERVRVVIGLGVSSFAAWRCGIEKSLSTGKCVRPIGISTSSGRCSSAGCQCVGDLARACGAATNHRRRSTKQCTHWNAGIESGN